METRLASKYASHNPSYVAMTHADLLVGTENPRSLTDFARRFFEIAHIAHFELRDSENYVDGHYFIARTGPRTFRVMLSADKDHRDVPYWIQVSATEETGSLTVAEIDSLAFTLVNQGYKVARIVNFGRHAEERFDYAADQ
jgi:hypothetical protein